MTKTNKEGERALEIERLQTLLNGRREEYELFGATTEDREVDRQMNVGR